MNMAERGAQKNAKMLEVILIPRAITKRIKLSSRVSRLCEFISIASLHYKVEHIQR